MGSWKEKRRESLEGNKQRAQRVIHDGGYGADVRQEARDTAVQLQMAIERMSR